ncbi:MAG: BspA family leucine-rich repeat surface protein [Clostridia bacterium]
MIKATNSIKGKINSPQNLKGKTNASTVKVYPELEDLTVTPSVEEQHFKSEKYGYDEVIVEKVTSEIDENIKPENIKEGTNILGVDGQYRGIDTSDATATANDILKDKTAYSQNKEITGTIETYDGSYEGNIGEENNAKLEISSSSFGVAKCLSKIELIDTSNCTDFKAAFKDCENIEYIPNLDTSNATTMEEMFYRCTKLKNIPQLETKNTTSTRFIFGLCENIETIPELDMHNAINCQYMFYLCKKLKTIPLLDCSKVYSFYYAFNQNINLTNLGGFLNLGKGYTNKTTHNGNHTLDLSYSPLLTHESLMNVINNLYDLNLTYDVANGGTLYRQSLVLGATNLAKLTEEEIAIATNKGWDIS